MTKINWPHGSETLVEHLERFSIYLNRKKKHDLGNLTVMVYGLYLHYKTERGFYSDRYEDLNKPLKNKLFTMINLTDMMAYGQSLIDKMQKELNVIVSK